jgi:hypothetical protein
VAVANNRCRRASNPLFKKPVNRAGRVPQEEQTPLNVVAIYIYGKCCPWPKRRYPPTR